MCLLGHAGLLEGAHAGRGLGHEFLRHCQRARMLVHIIDGSSPDPVGDFNAIQTELELFAEDLASKPQASFCMALDSELFTSKARLYSTMGYYVVDFRQCTVMDSAWALLEGAVVVLK